jgi:hypothetical protein
VRAISTEVGEEAISDGLAAREGGDPPPIGVLIRREGGSGKGEAGLCGPAFNVSPGRHSAREVTLVGGGRLEGGGEASGILRKGGEGGRLSERARLSRRLHHLGNALKYGRGPVINPPGQKSLGGGGLEGRRWPGIILHRSGGGDRGEDREEERISEESFVKRGSAAARNGIDIYRVHAGFAKERACHGSRHAKNLAKGEREEDGEVVSFPEGGLSIVDDHRARARTIESPGFGDPNLVKTVRSLAIPREGKAVGGRGETEGVL